MKTPKKYSWHFRKRNFLIFLLYFGKQLSKLKKWKTPTFKNFLFFLQKSFSYISRVVKTNFLILLVLKDKNSCFLPRRTPQGFSFFNFFRCFIFHLSRVFSVFTFLGCFHFPPFSGFHFSPVSGVSFFTFFGSFCVSVLRVLRIWESFISSLMVAGPLTEVRNTDPVHLFVWITQCSAKGISR